MLNEKNELAIYLFHQGTNYKAYELMGCHKKYDSESWIFRVWAPQAKAVYLTGDFNDWNYTSLPMKKINNEGIWQIEVDGNIIYNKYKFIIETDYGTKLLKADPYAFFSETRTATASIVYNDNYKWNDIEWISNRKTQREKIYKIPINIYEVHLGSWKKHENGNEYTYIDVADELIDYVKNMGYTHIEFLPLSEYPLDMSWGYQVTGYYAPTSRYGKPSELKQFIDKCHNNGIGVILDWVPAHFCKDSQGLIDFDGHPLYENPIPSRMEHKNWGTRIFDYARNEVSSFLISNAVYWINEFHFDALRVDAVASMLYHDYDRRDGEWIPNIYGGKENLEAIDFLKKLSIAIEEYTDGFLIAEESTAFPKVTFPAPEGLGFKFKWNMGWMNDTLQYAETDPYFRNYKHDKITFSMMYAYSEHFILPYSHDEVVHMKKSMLDKMPGTYEFKFAGLRTLESFMIAHPGKKLNFMGYEIGQFVEWKESNSLDWFLLDYDMHRKLQQYIKDLNHLYLSYPQFYENDIDWQGFEWLTVDDKYNNVLVFERKNNSSENIVAIFNFSNVTLNDYKISIDKGEMELLLNSDDIEYGGFGTAISTNLVPRNEHFKNKDYSISMTIPANCALFYIHRSRK